MTLLLRIELIILAVAAIVFVVHTVNKRILLLKYSLIWLLISLVLIIAACFPKIAFSVTALVGIETPSNLIFFWQYYHCWVSVFLFPSSYPSRPKK